MRQEELAALCALMSVRWPPAPEVPGFTFGPFEFYGKTSSGDHADVDFINGAGAPLTYDLKLNTQAGINGSGTKPTGFLVIDSVGIDYLPRGNTQLQAEAWLRAWALIHVPQASQKPRGNPFTSLARLGAMQATTQSDDLRIGAGGQQLPNYVQLEGGPYLVNVNTDAMVARIGVPDAAGVTLTEDIPWHGRMHGFYVSESIGRGLNLDKPDVICRLSPADIASVVGARVAQGLQPVIGR